MTKIIFIIVSTLFFTTMSYSADDLFTTIDENSLNETSLIKTTRISPDLIKKVKNVLPDGWVIKSNKDFPNRLWIERKQPVLGYRITPNMDGFEIRRTSCWFTLNLVNYDNQSFSVGRTEFYFENYEDQKIWENTIRNVISILNKYGTTTFDEFDSTRIQKIRESSDKK